jgi:hypothetical protein
VADNQKLSKDPSIVCKPTRADTFQAIAAGKTTYAKEPVFNIESANISCDEVAKLLGSTMFHVQ